MFPDKLSQYGSSVVPMCVQVSDHPDSVPPTAAPAAGIVGALMEVMQKRSKAIHSSGALRA